MSIVIRHAEPGDFEAVQGIFEAPEAIAGTLQVPFPSAEAWRKLLAEQQPGGKILLATIDGRVVGQIGIHTRSEEHTSELQSPCNLVCRLLLEKKNKKYEPNAQMHTERPFPPPLLAPHRDQLPPDDIHLHNLEGHRTRPPLVALPLAGTHGCLDRAV